MYDCEGRRCVFGFAFLSHVSSCLLSFVCRQYTHARSFDLLPIGKVRHYTYTFALFSGFTILSATPPPPSLPRLTQTRPPSPFFPLPPSLSLYSSSRHHSHQSPLSPHPPRRGGRAPPLLPLLLLLLRSSGGGGGGGGRRQGGPGIAGHERGGALGLGQHVHAQLLVGGWVGGV